MLATDSHFAKPAEVCLDLPWSHCYSDATTCPRWWKSQDGQDLSFWFYGYVWRFSIL